MAESYEQVVRERDEYRRRLVAAMEASAETALNLLRHEQNMAEMEAVIRDINASLPTVIKDAERYRFLREHATCIRLNVRGLIRIVNGSNNSVDLLEGQFIDNTIDILKEDA